MKILNWYRRMRGRADYFRANIKEVRYLSGDKIVRVVVEAGRGEMELDFPLDEAIDLAAALAKTINEKALGNEPQGDAPAPGSWEWVQRGL